MVSKYYPGGRYEGYEEFEDQHELRAWLDPSLEENLTSNEPVFWPFMKRVV